MPDPRRWTALATRRVLDRWWIGLRQDRVRLPDGHVLDEYHVVEYPDWACILAITAEGQAVLVEQYRYGVDRTGLELPAGVIERGEEPLAAARRELREETGYEAAQWDLLGRLAVEPARHTNHAHVFIAQDARRVGEQALDAAEQIDVRLVDVSLLPGMVEDGTVSHGIHAATIFWALSRSGNGPRIGETPRTLPEPSRTPSPPTSPRMHKEQNTILVSINQQDDQDQDARMKTIGAHVGEGWTVIQAIPVSGGEAGPGGASEGFMRYQVTVEREIDDENVVVGADRGGAARLRDVGQVSAAFDDPLESPEDGGER